jgi:hypothetical protein
MPTAAHHSFAFFRALSLDRNVDCHDVTSATFCSHQLNGMLGGRQRKVVFLALGSEDKMRIAAIGVSQSAILRATVGLRLPPSPLRATADKSANPPYALQVSGLLGATDLAFEFRRRSDGV